MVAKGEYDLMANRSDRRLPTLVCVRAHQHEAGRMIRDSGARISIKATGATHAPDLVGRIYDRNLFPSAVAPPCTRAGSIYDTKKRARQRVSLQHQHPVMQSSRYRERQAVGRAERYILARAR